ncbi:MAG TPA: aromatic amino acid lyase [Solirubrobacteraceae bacterium]|nr:aromatic amino acid lyase [Solirubrobacteraceae bacterium]
MPISIVAAMDGSVSLDGVALSPEVVTEIARGGAAVAIAPGARERMQAAAAVVARAADAGTPVYGVTTGLGNRVVDRIDGHAAAAFSLQTLRGRAMSVGERLPAELTRAAMAVRCNGLCAGGSGATVAIAEGLAALLNAGVSPCVPRTGSVGASDLCMLAHVGLTLIGEGEAELEGRPMPSADALTRAGLAPVRLGPKDGLAICSSSAVTAGVAALAVVDAAACLDTLQVAAALSMEGFRANLSPLDPRVVAARPAPGQAWAADGLRALLSGGALTQPGAARRVQDPLSLRCVSQIHGSLHVALALLAAAVEPELGGAADNPLVLSDDEEILSTGNFHVPALAMALDATAIALAQVAGTSSERQARLKTERLSALPAGLSPTAQISSGLSPLSKTAQALTLEIRHLAAPLSIMPTIGADSVEDDSTGATHAALRVREQIERLRLLAAIELIVAAQAVDLAVGGRGGRGGRASESLGAGTGVAHAAVRECVAVLEEDRPVGPDVERLTAELLVGGQLLERVGGAVGARS